MFRIPYKVPLFETAPISTWSLSTNESKETKATTAFTLTAPLGTDFIIEDLVFNYTPKPYGEPVGRTGRVHNVYVDAYKGWESLQLAAHLKGSQPGSVAASEDYTALVSKHIYDERMTLFTPKTRPKSLHALVTDKMKYGKLIADIPLPLALADSGAPTLGFDAGIVGWGTAVHKVHMAKTASLKTPERVAYASYHPVPAGPRPEGVYTTDLILVAPRDKNDKTGDAMDVCITEVPWREDGSLYGPSPVLLDDKGEELWRKIGPQDIAPGSEGAIKFDLRNAVSLYKTEGTLNKRVMAKSVFFRRPATVKPRAAASAPVDTASREQTRAILRGLEVSEKPLAPVYAPAAASAPGGDPDSDSDDPDEEDEVPSGSDTDDIAKYNKPANKILSIDISTPKHASSFKQPRVTELAPSKASTYASMSQSQEKQRDDDLAYEEAFMKIAAQECSRAGTSASAATGAKRPRS